MKATTASALVTLALLWVPAASADSFGTGASAFTIEFVDIGNPGNPDDTTGNPNPAGKVDYGYRIAQFEISEDMVNRANALGGLDITHNNRGANQPATSISWLEAAKFVNWLNTSTGHTPAYKFDGGGSFQLWQSADTGYDPDNLYRNSLAYYFLPSMDEWYKAAYYDPIGDLYYDYPTGSNSAPTPVAGGTSAGTAVYGQATGTSPADITFAGGLSPYGTMGQGGNVYEWEETALDLVNDAPSDSRGLRGGRWIASAGSLSASSRISGNPSTEGSTVGFRVASVPIPEPSTLTLVALGLLASGGVARAPRAVYPARALIVPFFR
jgi:formylglycine-generating enzyme required for sulfatase activity